MPMTASRQREPLGKYALSSSTHEALPGRVINRREESEEDFRELYNAIRSELNPESPLEEEAVFDIVRLHWLKRRAIQAAKARQGIVRMTSKRRLSGQKLS